MLPFSDLFTVDSLPLAKFSTKIQFDPTHFNGKILFIEVRILINSEPMIAIMLDVLYAEWF
jgi:hypothetical protein